MGLDWFKQIVKLCCHQMFHSRRDVSITGHVEGEGDKQGKLSVKSASPHGHKIASADSNEAQDHSFQEKHGLSSDIS